MFLRIFGWFFILLAVMVLGYDCWLWAQSTTSSHEFGMHMFSIPLLSLGELWFTLSTDTLNLLQVFVQRTLLVPELWEQGFVPLLALPASMVFGGLGIILLLLSFLFRRKKEPEYF